MIRRKNIWIKQLCFEYAYTQKILVPIYFELSFSLALTITNLESSVWAFADIIYRQSVEGSTHMFLEFGHSRARSYYFLNFMWWNLNFRNKIDNLFLKINNLFFFIVSPFYLRVLLYRRQIWPFLMRLKFWKSLTCLIEMMNCCFKGL